MREDPGFDAASIIDCLARHDGLAIASLEYLPIGHDMRAFVYRATARDGRVWFVKVRVGSIDEANLLVPAALNDLGIHEVLAPLRTHRDELWRPLPNGAGVILYPFIEGENAKIVGLSDDQWRGFGRALNAIHASGLQNRFQDQLPRESFALPSAALVRRLSALVRGAEFQSPAAREFAAFWRKRQPRIDAMLDRAESLGRVLQAKSFDHVLCHTDIHAANILIGDDGRIWLIDWDAPLIAPRERDLLVIIGSRIARTVTPHEEDLFFEGYGPTEIDREALIYYRYERIVEDIGEFGRSVLLEPNLSEAMRESEAAFGRSFFEPGADLDRAETVPRTRWPHGHS